MPSLVESRLLRLVILGALYFAQGVPWGFIAVGYVVFLTDQGLDNAAIGGAIGLAYLPWSFKIIAGPMLDRVAKTRFGRRRPFIIGAEFLMGLSLLSLLFIDAPRQLVLVGAILFAHNTFAAVQDVATDALAVDILKSDERGTANSVMWAAKSLGVAVGGGAGTVLAKHFGWSTLFVVNAVVIWVVMLLVIAVRERPKGDDGPTTEQRFNFAQLKRSFGFSTPLLGLVVALVAPIGYALVGAIFTRLLRADLGLSEERIAFISGTVDPVSSVGGALCGGLLADRIGVRRAMGGALGVVAVTLCVFAWKVDSSPGLGFLIPYVVVNSAAVAAFNAASLGFFMTLSNPAIGATQFAAFMAATNLTYAWASPAGGKLADSLGISTTFFIAATIQLLAIALLPLVDPKRAELRFRQAAEDGAGA